MYNNYLFEITEKSGRKIHLSNERWSHIRKKHPEIEDLELLENTVKNPDKIVKYLLEDDIYYFYRFFKELKPPKNFLLIVIKYLNGKGYIITAYLEKNIKSL